ncbi:MAG: hypothetical protein CMQ15_02440 [Gammaproteobacteria bacterium]|jgi:hypothetical protein|nr:hypothetical protein [Gammaproteobacteria bacterium]HJN95279.1 S1/P1 nuclease [Gammaproteobacteria bacterium]|tara:strand:- start:4546 stop:5538 length:993 start_codon:yes stop_codon:yes gene_type:complete
MQRILQLLSLLALFTSAPTVIAWDSIGHRVTAAVALQFISDDKQSLLLELLGQHPRFEEDFLDAMPDFIAQGSTAMRQEWLLGQAAFWPDIARGIPPAARDRYNHPSWHFIDGAWVRGAALSQGNIYIGIARFPDIQGEEAATIREESMVHNVITALDYNARVLREADRPAADRAVALCWLLHLVGDLHQPLHTGALFSATVLEEGDRGGNGIPTDDGTLHARWDRALRDDGIADSVARVLAQITRPSRPRIRGVESDWTEWLSESRQLLRSVVYSEEMRAEIAAADRLQREIQLSNLSESYITQMKQISQQRLGLAGLRLAIWIENELN